MADEIDSRMEQIRIKNEELEKKHKEILKDEEEARKQGAVIDLKKCSEKNSGNTPHRCNRKIQRE